MGPGCSNLIRSPYRFARIPQNTSPAFFVFITFITFIAKSRNIRKIWNTCWKLDRRFWTLTCFCASSTVLLFSLHLLIHALRLVLQLLSCQVVQQNMSSLGKKHSSWRIPFSTTPCSVAGNAMRILWNHLLSQNCACPTWVEIAKWELIFHTYQVRCIFEYSYAAWNEIVPDFRRNKSIFGISDAITKMSFGQNENPQKQNKYLWNQWQGLDLSWCSCSFSFWSRSATSCASSFSRWFKVSLASSGFGAMSLSKMEGSVDVSLGGRIPRLKPIVWWCFSWLDVVIKTKLGPEAYPSPPIWS